MIVIFKEECKVVLRRWTLTDTSADLSQTQVSADVSVDQVKEIGIKRSLRDGVILKA